MYFSVRVCKIQYYLSLPGRFLLRLIVSHALLLRRLPMLRYTTTSTTFNYPPCNSIILSTTWLLEVLILKAMHVELAVFLTLRS